MHCASTPKSQSLSRLIVIMALQLQRRWLRLRLMMNRGKDSLHVQDLESEEPLEFDVTYNGPLPPGTTITYKYMRPQPRFPKVVRVHGPGEG